jgi:catechol 2,3-dioxygenase-like lactoylglutathione lyase family enzyme
VRLNHLNLTVPDVQKTRDFFETYFGFRCVAERAMEPPREFHGAWTFYFRAPGGFLVEVMHQHRAEHGQ